ncbi:MAG: DNA polymerase III subunit delta' [Wenzhouxiangella sp.]
MILPWLDRIRTDLAARLDEGRLGHAPLISGPAGLGKLELARGLAARMLCQQPEGARACGRCRSCELLDSGAHPDYFEIDVAEDKQVIPVDDIRGLIENMQLTPALGSRRVGLIVDADAMNANAANALLKTLEEPAANAWLILRSHHPSRLPATIRSRCQVVALRPPPTDEAEAWLAEACPDHAPEKRRMALSLTGNAPLAARTMLVDDDLEHGLEILGLMLDNGGRAGWSAVLESWQKDAAGTWQWLARWIAMFMESSQGAESISPPEGYELPRNLDPQELAGLWQKAIEGRRLAAATAIRQDLLLGKWLLEWERVNAAGK